MASKAWGESPESHPLWEAGEQRARRGPLDARRPVGEQRIQRRLPRALGADDVVHTEVHSRPVDDLGLAAQRLLRDGSVEDHVSGRVGSRRAPTGELRTVGCDRVTAAFLVLAVDRIDLSSHDGLVADTEESHLVGQVQLGGGAGGHADRGAFELLEPSGDKQLPALVERGRASYRRFLERVDPELATRQFLAGDTFSIADITAYIAMDFAKRGELEVPPSCANVLRWQAYVAARPSASA